MSLELNAPGFGIWGVRRTRVPRARRVAFLYDGSLPDVSRYRRAVIATVAVFVGAFFFLVLTKRAEDAAHGRPPEGPKRLVGKEGVVIGRGLDPKADRARGIRGMESHHVRRELAARRSARAWSPGSTVSRSPSMPSSDDGRDGRHGAGPKEGGTRDGRQHRADRRGRDRAARDLVILVNAIKVVPRVPAAGRVPPGAVAGPEGPGPRAPDPVRRQGDGRSTSASSSWRSRARTRSPRTTRRSPWTSSCSTR